MPTIAKAYTNLLSAIEFKEAAQHGMDSNSLKAKEFRERSSYIPSDAYYFPLDADARGCAPGSLLKTINPIHASNLAFDEESCWVGTACTNLWPIKCGRGVEELPSNLAGTLDASDSEWTGWTHLSDGGAVVTLTNLNGIMRTTLTTVGTATYYRFTKTFTAISPAVVAIRARASKNLAAGQLSIRAVVGGSGVAIFQFPAMEAGEWYTGIASNPGSMTSYRLTRTGSFTAGEYIEASYAYAGDGSYVDGSNILNANKGWQANTTTGHVESTRIAIQSASKHILRNAGGDTVLHSSSATGNSLAITSGTAYTVSCYYRLVKGNITGPAQFTLVKSTGGADITKSDTTTHVPVIKEIWRRGCGSSTFSESVTAWPYITISSSANMEARVCAGMIQTGPFMSAYCENSRAAGMLTFNLHASCGLNWNQDFTIIYWKRAHGTANNTLGGYSTDSIGRNGNTIGGGYRFWGKDTGVDSLRLSGSVESAVPFSFSNFQYKWHMVVLRKTGVTLQASFYGIDNPNGSMAEFSLDDSTASTANRYVTQDGRDLQLGGWDQTNACNAYYRDLVVIPGRYVSNDELQKMWNTKFRSFANTVDAANFIETLI
jgi:hypothetical protein